LIGTFLALCVPRTTYIYIRGTVIYQLDNTNPLMVAK
jgi:hypothetical protein